MQSAPQGKKASGYFCSYVGDRQWACSDGSDGFVLPEGKACAYGADGALRCEGSAVPSRRAVPAPQAPCLWRAEGDAKCSGGGRGWNPRPG